VPPLARQALITAPDEGAADLDPIHAGHDAAPGPRGAQDAVALELAGDLTPQVEDGLRPLPRQGVADGVFAERADARGQHACAALGLEAVQGGELAGGAQKHRVEDLRPRVARRLTGFGQRLDLGREVKHLLEVDFTRVPAHGSVPLSLLQEPPQIDLADRGGGRLKPLAQFHVLAHHGGQPGGDVEGLGLPLDEHRELELGVEALPIGAAAVGLTAPPLALDEGAREHLTQRPQATNESPTTLEVGIWGGTGSSHMTLIVVSDILRVKTFRRFAKMTPNPRSPTNTAGSTAWATLPGGFAKSLGNTSRRLTPA